MKSAIRSLFQTASRKLSLAEHRAAIRNLNSPAMGMADSPTSEQMAAVLELRAEQVQLCEKLGMIPPEPPRLSGKGASELKALADELHRGNADLAFQANRQAAKDAAPVRLTPVPAKASTAPGTNNNVGEEAARVVALRGEQLALCEQLGKTPPPAPDITGKSALELKNIANGQLQALYNLRKSIGKTATANNQPSEYKTRDGRMVYNPKQIADAIAKEREEDRAIAAKLAAPAPASATPAPKPAPRRADEKSKAAADGMALAIKIGRRITAPAKATAAPSPEPRKPLVAAMPVPTAQEIAAAMLDEQERRASAPVGLQKTIAAFQALKPNR